jgi:cell division inhibitor SepF
MNIILEKPTLFEQTRAIADKLATGKAIVINLEETPKEIQRRIVDFMSGAAYAHGGDMKKVSKYIFVVAAQGVSISGELFGEDFDDDRIYF